MERLSIAAKTLILLFVAGSFGVCRAAPGDLDPAFGTDGRTIVNMGRSNHFPTAVVAQPDGKYYISYGTDIYTGGIARFSADHTLDATWGFRGNAGIGRQTTGIAISGDKVLAVENGEIRFGGSGPSGQYVDTYVSRYTLSGEPDATFGYGGRTLPFPAGGNDFSQRFGAISIAPNGKIIAVGEASGAAFVVRYSVDGLLDTTFGANGWTRVTPGIGILNAGSVAVQPDGKIVIAGTGGATPNGFVMRLTDTGVLDTNFGNGGIYQLPHESGTTNCRSVLLDGTRIIMGCTQTNGDIKTFLLIGLTTTGTVDPAFNSTPLYASGTNNVLSTLFKHPDGRLFAAGRGGANGDRAVVLALNANGGIASNFASGGLYVSPEVTVNNEIGAAPSLGWNGSEFVIADARAQTVGDDAIITTLTSSGLQTSLNYSSLGSSSGSFLRLKALPGGHIVTAGVAIVNTQRNFVVSRIHANGVLDNSFGTYGLTTIDTGSDFLGARDFTLQADGKIALTGQFGLYFDSPSFNVGAVRLLANGAIDQSFSASGTPGQAVLSIPGTSNIGRGRAIRAQSDGKALVLARSSRNSGNVGSSGVVAPGKNMVIVRFNIDGTIDNSYGANGLLASDSLGNGQYMDLDASGRAVIAGTIFLPGQLDSHISLVRINIDGTSDATFGIGGIASTPLPTDVWSPFVNKLLIMPTGKIQVAMNVRIGGNTGTGLMQVNADGSLDTTFGNAGFSFVVTSPNIDFTSDVLDAAITPDGRTVLTTMSRLNRDDSAVSTLVRILANGTPDSSFGTGGVRYYTPLDGTFLGVDALADGAILISGAVERAGNLYGMIAKTLPDSARGGACRI